MADDRQAVKYSVFPREPLGSKIPKDPARNYLRFAMADTLSKGKACFIFGIQPRPNPSYSVEDVITEWDEKVAPFHPVAKIIIDKQKFNTPDQNPSCEDEVYNPWHSLEAHRPIGAISRMRRVVYEGLSDFRLGKNFVKR
jgi:hypothetical protein